MEKIPIISLNLGVICLLINPICVALSGVVDNFLFVVYRPAINGALAFRKFD